MKNLIIVLLLLSPIATTTNAQNLSKMPETKRNEKLIKTAKEAIKKHAPDYYKYTSGKYTIELIDKNNIGEKIREYYEVSFPDYNKDEELFANGHPVSVQIWADSGVADIIWSGHGWGIDVPEKLKRGQEVPKLEYKRTPPYKPSPGRQQKVH